MEQQIKNALVRLYGSAGYTGAHCDYENVVSYIEELEHTNTKLERVRFGLQQQVANLREKDEKMWRHT